MGDECHLGPAAAERLEIDSIALREHLSAASQPLGNATPAGVSTQPDPGRLAEALNDSGRHSSSVRPEVVPALQQLLTAENGGVREVLVDQLARIDGRPASIALARRALFDLHPGVRTAALAALRARPAEEYCATLLDGFRYPWLIVADHAAEALVSLDLKEAVPALLALLDLPDPDRPYHKSDREGAFVREVVRVNHLRNCVLCHAASLDTGDKVRGRIPPTNLPLPPPSSRQYYVDNSGDFVRADITYLQQDFSVPLPVAHAEPWPAVQRFDFLVRERLSTPARARDVGASKYHRAIFFALRELTGHDPGPSAEDWKHLFLGQVRVTPLAGSWRSPAGVAADALGRVWVNQRGRILRAHDGPPAPLVEGDFRSLAADSTGNLLACSASNVLSIGPQGQVRVLANSWRGQLLGGPLHVAADHAGGVYFTDAATASSRGAVFYLSKHGVLTRLEASLKRPSGVALAPDDKTLYLRAAGAAEVMAYPLEATGLPGPGRVFCRLQSSSADDGALAVDGRGNVLVPTANSHALHVFHVQGALLGRVPLPDAPQDCTAAADGRAVYVTTATGVCVVRFDSPVELAAR
jgi:sugar lactone lactonase YvrE